VEHRLLPQPSQELFPIRGREYLIERVAAVPLRMSSGYGEQPLPLLTAALAFVAFGLPSLVALVVLIVVGLRAG